MITFNTTNLYMHKWTLDLFRAFLYSLILLSLWRLLSHKSRKWPIFAINLKPLRQWKNLWRRFGRSLHSKKRCMTWSLTIISSSQLKSFSSNSGLSHTPSKSWGKPTRLQSNMHSLFSINYAVLRKMNQQSWLNIIITFCTQSLLYMRSNIE